MNPIDLNLADNLVIEIRGCVYDSMDAGFLCDDILEVDLRTGKTIEVGWVGDPSNGYFRIVVFRDFWTNQIGSEIRVHTPKEVVEWIQYLAETHGEEHVVSDTDFHSAQSHADYCKSYSSSEFISV